MAILPDYFYTSGRYDDPQAYIDDLWRMVKALVIAGSPPLLEKDKTEYTISHEMFVSDQITANIDDYSIEVKDSFDPWGVNFKAVHRQSYYADALKDAFTNDDGTLEVPTPEQLREAAKAVFGNSYPI